MKSAGILDKLEPIEKRFEELNNLISDAAVATDQGKLQQLAREQAEIRDTVERFRQYKDVLRNMGETERMLDRSVEPEMAALVKEEINHLQQKADDLLQELKMILMPRDPNDKKDVIMEVRAGTGGEEASLFAADLFRMYQRYSQIKGWHTEIIDASGSEAGGFKEVVFELKGKGAFSRLKYERGVHRVQRVPTTEASGRIHTSTATVVVLPAAEEIEVDINPEDLRIDIFRSGGAGGQNVNKVATAVRITHIPTGIVAVCQDERSQLKNKLKAMAVLRARIYDIQQRRQQEKTSSERRSQVGTGERAEKIRTYNYPQNRVTDHRINISLHNLSSTLDGQLDDLIDALAISEQTEI